MTTLEKESANKDRETILVVQQIVSMYLSQGEYLTIEQAIDALKQVQKLTE